MAIGPTLPTPPQVQLHGQVQDAPPPPGLNSAGPPLIKVGLTLSQIVLGIVGGTIVILFVYLAWRDAGNDTAQNKFYAEAMSQISAGGNFPDTAAIEKWRGDIRLLASPPPAPGPTPRAGMVAPPSMTDEDTRQARMVLGFLRQDKAISDEQAHALELCTGPTSMPSEAVARTAALKQCGDLLDTLDKQALGAAGNLEKDRLLVELTKQVEEHRQNFHAFVIQISQMILLNLLLPLLTALFGYMFGAQQARP
jgi:hypothetical protein